MREAASSKNKIKIVYPNIAMAKELHELGERDAVDNWEEYPY